jgi:hypothetical protein
MESNTNDKKGFIKRIVGNKIHYYDYKNILIKRETYDELRGQSKKMNMSMPKYILWLLKNNK